jgi:predicted CoA-binding protein
MSRKVVVIGASPNESRYSYMATSVLRDNGFDVYPLGIRAGEIGSSAILLDRPVLEEIDTVTMYVGPRIQVDWFDYIRALKPKRVIFNPGTENSSVYNELDQLGIAYEEACTLVLLNRGAF